MLFHKYVRHTDFIKYKPINNIYNKLYIQHGNVLFWCLTLVSNDIFSTPDNRSYIIILTN